MAMASYENKRGRYHLPDYRLPLVLGGSGAKLNRILAVSPTSAPPRLAL
jgi:hypothetical protein